jgi:hypothetical protein
MSQAKFNDSDKPASLAKAVSLHLEGNLPEALDEISGSWRMAMEAPRFSPTSADPV